MSISSQSNPPKPRLGRALAVGGAAVLTGLVVALGPAIARGNADSGSGSATGSGPGIRVPTPTVTAGKATGTAAERNARAEAFTACMRENGAPNFPGVTVGADGTLQLVSGGDVNPISKSYQVAAKKCASKLPSGSALPAEPSVPAPAAPAKVDIDCSGTACPAAPAAPKAPALPN